MSDFLLETLDLEISNPCNEKCVHCYRTCEQTKSGFLSCDDVEFILKETSSFMTDDALVLLTGGEPLLNKEWRGMVQTVSNAGKRVAIYTNGTLMTEGDADFIAGFVGKGLKEVQFSLYAMDEATHDAVTGLKGSCAKTKNAIQMLKERGVRVFVSIPAMQINKNEFYKVMSWCDKNDIPSAAHPMIFGQSDYSDSNASQRLTEKDLEEVFEITMQNNAELAYIWGDCNRKKDVPKELYFHESRGICIAGDGNIYPAIGVYEKLGNIHTDNLKDVFYNSSFYKEARTYLMKDSRCAMCDVYDFCGHYYIPHIIFNHGKLGEYDKRSCDYVHLVKKFALRRDKILSEQKERK